MQLVPYLTFDHTCEEALEFYKYCLGGKITYLERYKDAPVEVSKDYTEKILHAKFEFKSNVLFASDVSEDREVLEGDNVSLTITFDTKEEFEEVFLRLTEDALIKRPMQHTFWGTMYANFTDKYGISWILDYTKPAI